MIAPPPELVARFARDLAALHAGPVALGVAVSGGPDSLALLLLAHAALPPGGVRAATVDHGLRAEAAAEADMVAAVCAARRIPHTTLPVAVENGGQGLQAGARAARYRALGAWADAEGVEAIATAHHADDQAETLLMRLGRGSGLGGLAGIRAARPLGDRSTTRIVRPLLGWSKATLEAIVAAAGMAPVRDPANVDPRHDRTHARALLAATPRLDPLRLAASAAALGEAEAALAWATERLMGERWDGQALDVAGVPRELRRRLLARLLPEARGDAIVRLLDRLEAGRPGTLGDRLVRSVDAVWHVGAAPPRHAG